MMRAVFKIFFLGFSGTLPIPPTPSPTYNVILQFLHIIDGNTVKMLD